ncbi:nucleolar MIF4G domain-containing protein 1-like [Convolutriloba macropyga]|uniref:nucleolar MIF4G domain-containing protein 1-like n=1 Tax=Convolutriloba macropyga TaxID=536237 RepID=UPI003F526164
MKPKKKREERNFLKAKTDITKLLQHSSGSKSFTKADSDQSKQKTVDRKTARKLKREEAKNRKRSFHELKCGKVQENVEKTIKSKNKPIKKATKKVKPDDENSKRKVSSQLSELVDDGKLADDAELKRLSKKLKIKPGKVPRSFYEDGDLGTLLELCELKFDNEGIVDFNDVDLPGNSLGGNDGLPMFNVNNADDSDEIDSDICDSDNPEKEETSKSEEKIPSGKQKNIKKDKIKGRRCQDKSDVRESEVEVSDSSDLTEAKSDTSEPSSKVAVRKLDTKDKMKTKPENALSQTAVEIVTEKFDPYAGASKFYVPPQKRRKLETASNTESDFDSLIMSENFARIYKQCVGLLNRVSESNLNSISKQLELVYSNFGTSETNVAVSKAVISLCCQPFPVADRLIFEKVALISIVHKNTQTDIAAQFTHSVVWKIVQFWESNQNSTDSNELIADKTAVNCVKCLCYLYNFGTLSNNLIFDIVKRFLTSLTQPSIECLLAIVLNAGLSLRKNCPNDLKDIILAILKTGNEHLKTLIDTDCPKLEHFLDLVTALKNNNRRKLELVIDLDALVNIQDVVASLVSRTTSDGGGVINVSLEVITKSGLNGRWWNLGTNEQTVVSASDESSKLQNHLSTSENDEIIQLAHKCGMNTQFRESVFCAIMTSCDYAEASDKILRMNLKKHAREIPHIIIKCLMLEEKFNPFYFHLLKSFANYEKQNQVVLKFAISDRLKDLKMMTSKTEVAIFAELVSKLLLEKLIPPNLSLLPAINTNKLSTMFVKAFLRKFLSSKQEKLSNFLEDVRKRNESEILFNLKVMTKQLILDRYEKMSNTTKLNKKIMSNAKFVCEEIDNLC